MRLPRGLPALEVLADEEIDLGPFAPADPVALHVLDGPGPVDGLEVVPRQTINYRGAVFTELDLDAILARRPEVVLVDELAHTNVPGAGNAKRWQDIQTLRDAGMIVITTVNVQHLESLYDEVERITGVKVKERLPDSVLGEADHRIENFLHHFRVGQGPGDFRFYALPQTLSQAVHGHAKGGDVHPARFGHATLLVVITAAAIRLYQPLGFLITMTLLVFVLLVVVERRNIFIAALYSAGLTVFAYWLFGIILKAPLERGIFWL